MIRTTPNHPFYVRGRGWVQAQNLRIGDRFRGKGVGGVELVNPVDTGGIEPVFNLHVAERHTYFVGSSDVQSSVLVHNDSVAWARTKGAICGLGQSLANAGNVVTSTVIGVGNTVPLAYNYTIGWVAPNCPYIPDPDWSQNLVPGAYETPTSHAISKGGFDVALLAGTAAASLEGKAAQAAAQKAAAAAAEKKAAEEAAAAAAKKAAEEAAAKAAEEAAAKTAGEAAAAKATVRTQWSSKLWKELCDESSEAHRSNPESRCGKRGHSFTGPWRIGTC